MASRRMSGRTSEEYGSAPKRRLRFGPSVWAGIAVAAVILGLISDATNLVDLVPDDPGVPRLGGEVNIAVAGFNGIGSSRASEEGEQFSESLATALRRRAADARGPLAPAVEVAGPGELGDLEDARRLGQADLERLNATIGVAGTLRSEPQVSVLSTAIRVNTQQLHLAGQIDPVFRRRIRMAGSVGESVATRIRIRNRVADAVDLIDDLLLGLGELESEHPRRSRRLLSRVLAVWSQSAGTEVLYLLLGHSLAYLHRDDEARAAYRHALVLRPGFARARFSLAALDFRRAAEDCSRAHIEAGTIRWTRDEFAAVADRAVSTLRAKALFARARADACLSQAGFAHRFDAADATFAEVVAAYRGGTPGIRAEAAESLGWLGFIALPARGAGAGARDRADITAAVRYYRRAAALAIDPRRRRFFDGEADRWSRRTGMVGRV
jgi:tetratricopeptide (TPR) repeat protein